MTRHHPYGAVPARILPNDNTPLAYPAYLDHDAGVVYDTLKEGIFYTVRDAVGQITLARADPIVTDNFMVTVTRIEPDECMLGVLCIDFKIEMDEGMFTDGFAYLGDLWESAIEDCLMTHHRDMMDCYESIDRYIHTYYQIHQTGEHSYEVTTTYGLILTPEEVLALRTTLRDREKKNAIESTLHPSMER
jgi:hypothetical protein